MGKRIRAGSPLIAVAYVRVSKDEQKLGPEAQRALIESWAAHGGVQVAAWHVDQGVSGGSNLVDRPALVAAMGELRAVGAGVLVVAKRDRLARDVYVAATVERAVAASGARVVSADGTANGDTSADAFMRNILDAAAAYERSLIRARTKAALAVKKARGEKTGGGAPYGYRRKEDGQHVILRTGERRCLPVCPGCRNLEPVKAEQAVIAKVRALRADGASLADIAGQLGEAGHFSRTGKTFVPIQISRMIDAFPDASLNSAA